MNPRYHNQELFSAHAIAVALSVSRQWMFKALKTVPPSGQILKGGKPVNAWAFPDLPADLRARLDAEAVRLCFKNAEQLLIRGRTPWQPEIPLREIAEKHIQKAHLLKRALLPILEGLSDIDSLASVEKRGLLLYKETFGHSISSRHWRRLIKRTFNRDQGNDSFQRLEIYLDDKLTRRSLPVKTAKMVKDDFADARGAVSMVQDITKPSSSEKQIIWVYVLSAVEKMIQDGTPEKLGNKIALEFLNSECPFLAKSADALKAAFYRKAKAWKKSGGKPLAIKDNRHDRSGNWKAAPLSQTDEETLLAYTSIAGGRLAQGWREAMRDNVLSPELMQRYSIDERKNKSYVPNAIRAALQHKVQMVDEWTHGKHAAKMAGAFLDRDPNAIHAGDWQQMDETTGPIYWHNEREPRKPTRGQLLITVDVRTGYILSFLLAAAKGLNGRDVRNLMTITNDEFGLPRKGWYFENSIFKSEVVKGGIAWAETEAGLLTGLGLRFVHAREARAKLVERVFGLIQNYMERIPGYCGRNERLDHYERTEKLLQKVRGGKMPSREALLTQKELHKQISAIVAQVNSDPQNGKYCNGLSPEEAYFKYFGNESLVKLGRTTRYLLADSVKKVRIGRNGITIRRGKDTFIYKSEETGQLKGKEVLAWFSPENPEILSVTDLKKKNPFTVERAQSVPLMNADPDLLSQELERNAAHNAYGKRLFKAIKPHIPAGFDKPMFAPIFVDEQTAELGLEMEHQRQQAQKKQKRKASQIQKIKKSGFKPSPIAERRKAQADALPRLAEFLKETEPSNERRNPWIKNQN